MDLDLREQELLTAQLTRAKALYGVAGQWLDASDIEECSFRSGVYSGLGESVREHYVSIFRLLEDKPHYGSAFALLQPLIDNALSTLWVIVCTSRGMRERLYVPPL